MNEGYLKYELNQKFSTADFCKLFSHFPYFFLGHSNIANEPTPLQYGNYNTIVAGGFREIPLNEKEVFSSLKLERNHSDEWCFGYLSYDLKTETEGLFSQNKVYLESPNANFFYPAFIILESTQQTIIYYKETEIHPDQILKILNDITIKKRRKTKVNISPLCKKEEYQSKLKIIKEKIIAGDIYEINFCRAWKGEIIQLDPVKVFLDLNKISKAPFSTLLKMQHLQVIGASPERFIRKQGEQLLSQPIKGTRKRSKDVNLDNVLKIELAENKKEKSENVMIVDLVRNDLSRFAEKGSVSVEELFGVYTFEQVHQMISSISAKLKPSVHGVNAIRAAFPMGSMTGAPKVSAMKIIEETENFKRGIFSGSIGYFDDKGNFDFNVVIRSIIVNTKSNQLFFAAGGAITNLSDIDEEFEESNLKAKALGEVLNYEIE